MKELQNSLESLKKKAPLTLAITNQVTINECANSILAVGGSPVMSDEPRDAAALAALAAATVINIGTTSDYRREVMLAAIKGARDAGRPIVLDPVGVGATVTRRETALTLIGAHRPDIVRGNFAEIKALAGLATEQKGVDSTENGGPEMMAQVAQSLAAELKNIVAVTGAIDVVADGRDIFFIKGGTPLLTRLTGTGCALSAIVGAYAGANPEHLAHSLVAALVHMSLAGERARQEIEGDRLGSFRVKLFDHLALISPADLADYQGVTHVPG